MNWLTDFKFSPYRFTVFATAVLIINHGVGLVGLNSGNPAYYEDLSWLNLFISLLLVAVSFRDKNFRFALFAFIVFCLGMLAEITGVSTGWPFGDYYYTNVLGFSLLAVPLIIGLNWILLTLSCGALVSYFFTNTWMRILLAAWLMVLTDVLLEPFAIKHHFWVWAEARPPFSNYLAWFLISLIAQFLFTKLVASPRSLVAVIYAAILVVFLIADKISA